MLRHLVLLASVPLVLVAAIGALSARAQTSAGDTPSDDAPAAVQNNATVDSADDGAFGSPVTPTAPATVGGAATTRAPGGVLGGAVGTGTLAPSTSSGIRPAGTNEAPARGQSTTGGPSTFGGALPPGGFLVPGTYAPGLNGAPGAWVPGLGMAPGSVVGPGLAGASSTQAPLAIPSGVAVGNDGRPFNERPRNVGEGEGESPANDSAARANANPIPAQGVAMPAAVYIVAPGFVPSSAANSDASARSARGLAGAGADAPEADVDEAAATPLEVTVADLGAGEGADYAGRRVNLRGRVTRVDGDSMFTIGAKGSEITVVHPSALSDTPLREDVIVTGVVEKREGRNVLVAESVIQIER